MSNSLSHSLHIINYNSPIKKIIGLIGKKNPNPIFFKTRFGIHTIGLFYPIDVIITDKNYKVVKMRESLKPLRIFLWNPRYDTVIELPEGTIKKENIQIGDHILFECRDN